MHEQADTLALCAANRYAPSDLLLDHLKRRRKKAQRFRALPHPSRRAGYSDSDIRKVNRGETRKMIATSIRGNLLKRDTTRLVTCSLTSASPSANTVTSYHL